MEPRNIGDGKIFLKNLAVSAKKKRRHNTKLLIWVYIPAIKSMTKAYLSKRPRLLNIRSQIKALSEVFVLSTFSKIGFMDRTITTMIENCSIN